MFPIFRVGLLALILIFNACKNDDPTWPKSAKRFVLGFSFATQPGVKATVDDAAGIIQITVGNIDLTKLVPTIQLSDKATITPATNVAQDFSNPVSYTVTAQNGLRKTYAVTVTQEYNETLLAGNSDGYLYAFAAQTGKFKWKFKTGGAIKSDVTVSEGMAFFGSEDKKFYAIDIKTGDEKWSVATESAPQNSCPLISNGVVYFTDRLQLYAVEISTGKLKWKSTGDNHYITSPTFANGWICVGGAKKLASYEVVKGVEKWVFNAASDIVSNPAVSSGLIYVGLSGADSSGFFAINAADGKQKWATKAASTVNRIRSSPKLANGYIYVGSENKSLFALNAADGILKWSLPLNESVSSSPLVADSLLVLNTASGISAYVFRTDFNTIPKLKWSFPQNGSTSGILNDGSPVYANGVIYAAGAAGFMAAVNAIAGTSAVQFEPQNAGVFTNPCIVTHQGIVFQSGVSGALH